MLHPDEAQRLFLIFFALVGAVCFAARLVGELGPAMAILWRFGPAQP